MSFKCGFVTILGRPNAGKSTLLNALVGRKVAIVTPRPQTTRNRIQGIVNREDAQIVLLDTPGIHKPETALGKHMMREVNNALEGIDIVVLIVDASEEFGAGDKFALELVKKFHGPAILLLNKIDRTPKASLLPQIDRYHQSGKFAEIIPISALTGEALPRVLEALAASLPEATPVFPQDQFTDQPERFLAAEMIREKAILATREEVPHSIAVLVDNFEEKPRLLRIRATIYVEREGQKGIVIGKGGAHLKKIGTDARKEMEILFDSKVFLELHVKVEPNWRNDSKMVRQLDWHVQLEEMGLRQQAEEEE
ncbi:MAG: GTPase Era [Acidobacteria bacterium]|nr:GTPase Era [Acidobacteriota bacterium]